MYNNEYSLELIYNLLQPDCTIRMLHLLAHVQCCNHITTITTKDWANDHLSLRIYVEVHYKQTNTLVKMPNIATGAIFAYVF